MKNVRLYVQYGAALIAAPIFCWIYISLSGEKANDPLWLINNREMMMLLVFFYPLIEEVTFRGVIQEYIAFKVHYRIVYGVLSLANMLTSFLFVLIHTVYHPMIWAFAVFVPSLVFGYFKERFGRIYPSVILHMVYNMIFFSLVGN